MTPTLDDPHGDGAILAADPASTSGWARPTRQFALLSLLTIGSSTLLFGFALAYFVERGILDREWASTAALVRTAARFYLRSADFAPRDPPALAADEAGDRFEEFARQVRMLPEIEQLVAYDAGARLLWADTGRPPAVHAPHRWLREAVTGETSVRLEAGTAGAPDRVELYVPITFPGEGRVAGVVEAYIEPSRVLAIVRRARMTLWTLAFLSGAVLYVALYGIVWRASRVLRAQHAALIQRATDLARANADLRAVQQQLVAAERLAAFGEITAAVAHGIGNPLAAIRSLAQLAGVETDDARVRDRVDQVVVQADRLAARMRALLRLGSPIEQRPMPGALDRSVHMAVDSVRTRCAANRIRVEIDVPSELPKVTLDPAGFEEAFLCLVGNAVDAMPQGGVLRVHAAVPPAHAEALTLVVEDTGPGIPPEMLRQVFEPFFTTKRNGTGLGLALARRLLEAAGAHLAIESEPGRGTRAVITVPLDRP